ncbi:MAG TPA: SDR family NAD(P)-dependent oxidoreductase [Burkholderiales bacterium]|nr:SDR family NAD(P)-dependent oxidoreductase [Burkholderiales bacterium]
MKLDGRAAIVTGGASGIGLAVAGLFAAEGCRVAIADREPAAGEAPVDVADAAQVQALVRGTLARFGRLDILVNAAAIYPATPSLVETPESVWDEVLSVNLKGVFLCCKAAIPAMLESGGGSIVNLSSIGALRGTTYSVPYAAAKAGVIQLTRSAAVQYGPLGIRANCIVPGLVDTPMSRGTTGSAKEFARRAAEIPLGRAGKPEEIASLALYLASPEAAFVNGAAIVIDGGATTR